MPFLSSASPLFSSPLLFLLSSSSFFHLFFIFLFFYFVSLPILHSPLIYLHFLTPSLSPLPLSSYSTPLNFILFRFLFPFRLFSIVFNCFLFYPILRYLSPFPSHISSTPPLSLSPLLLFSLEPKVNLSQVVLPTGHLDALLAQCTSYDLFRKYRTQAGLVSTVTCSAVRTCGEGCVCI